MIKVYVAGKLNAMAPEYLRNCHRMMRQAERLRKAGCSVFIPCLDMLMGVFTGKWNYEDYFNNSQPWLEVADAMFVCKDYKGSNGTEKEIDRAEKARIPIFFDEDELLIWAGKKEIEDGRQESGGRDQNLKRVRDRYYTSRDPAETTGELVGRVCDFSSRNPGRERVEVHDRQTTSGVSQRDAEGV
jgi:hypothetical protein